MARRPAGPQRAPGAAPAVLVAGAGAAGLAAAQGAVRRATGAAVVGLQYARCAEATGTGTGGDVRFVRGGEADRTWEARGGTPAQAMVRESCAVPRTRTTTARGPCAAGAAVLLLQRPVTGPVLDAN